MSECRCKFLGHRFNKFGLILPVGLPQFHLGDSLHLKKNLTQFRHAIAKLKLRVNEAKSAVARPQQRKSRIQLYGCSRDQARDKHDEPIAKLETLMSSETIECVRQPSHSSARH